MRCPADLCPAIAAATSSTRAASFRSESTTGRTRSSHRTKSRSHRPFGGAETAVEDEGESSTTTSATRPASVSFKSATASIAADWPRTTMAFARSPKTAATACSAPPSMCRCSASAPITPGSPAPITDAPASLRFMLNSSAWHVASAAARARSIRASSVRNSSTAASEEASADCARS